MPERSEPRAAPWQLVAILSASEADGNHHVELLREVSDDEVRRTHEANSVINHLLSGGPYPRMVRFLTEIEQGLNGTSASYRRAANMSGAARGLGDVAADLPGHIRGHGLQEFGTSAEGPRLEEAITEECERPAFRVLLALRGLAQDLFVAGDEGVSLDDRAVAPLAAEAPDIDVSRKLFETLHSGVLVAQNLVARQLVICEEAISEASFWLRRLGAEVADGTAALMQSDHAALSAESVEAQATFEPLALDEALYLHQALRQAKGLLAGAEEGQEATQEPNSDPAARGGEVQDPGADAATQQSGEAPTTTGPPGEREDQVLDLRALANHVTELTDELERVWSDALDGAALEAAQEEVGIRLASLMNSIQRRLAASDRVVRSHGIDPALQPQDVGALTFHPDPELRWRQLQLAEVEAAQSLLDALTAMRSPSAHRVRLPTGPVESWWQAGAFDLVRARVRQLVRVSQAGAAAESGFLGKDVDADSRGRMSDRLQLAREALRRGDPEAATMHALLALRLLAEYYVTEVPQDLLSRLESTISNDADSALIRCLREGAQELAYWEEPATGVTALVAPRLLDLVDRICFDEPETMRSSLD